MKKLNLLFFMMAILFASSIVNAQQWGLYTLYSAMNGTTAYLKDTSGTTYKTWTFSSSYKTGFSSYLIPGDTLVRAVAYSGAQFTGGGITGEVQKVTWAGTVVWDYVHSSSTYCLHHDIFPMPNGNVLMISYESKTGTEATAAGCSQSITVWSEKIMEVHPTGATTGTIVWEWHLWDHLCQNYSSSMPNYVTSIVNNPQLMNINYNTAEDWIHMNGIDYNEALDQITFSSRTMNEIYVIDHSTTTAEAATHSGGNSGKGGDFLYRWGNPAAYGATGTTNFNVVHDAHWVPSDNPNYPNYLCAFDNGGGTGGKSAIDIISPPYNGYNYSYTVGQAMPPTTTAYTYNSSYTSQQNGGSKQLPNGNILICISNTGYIYEINSSGTSLWSLSGGANVPNVERYDKCYVRGPIISTGASLLEICAGDAVTLNSSATSVTETSPTYTYSWSSSPAGFSSTLQNPSVTPTITTTYTVIITNTNIICSDTATVTVTVNPLPAPTIIQNGTTLTSSSAVSYQWYYNSNIISGATSQSYNPTQDGPYQVEVTDANGCTGISAVFNYVATVINEVNDENILQIFPNPTTGILNIEGIAFENQNYKIAIFDSYGKVLFRGENTKTINLSGFENGIYFLSLNSENMVNYKKIILIN